MNTEITHAHVHTHTHLTKAKSSDSRHGKTDFQLRRDRCPCPSCCYGQGQESCGFLLQHRVTFFGTSVLPGWRQVCKTHRRNWGGQSTCFLGKLRPGTWQLLSNHQFCCAGAMCLTVALWGEWEINGCMFQEAEWSLELRMFWGFSTYVTFGFSCLQRLPGCCGCHRTDLGFGTEVKSGDLKFHFLSLVYNCCFPCLLPLGCTWQV